MGHGDNAGSRVQRNGWNEIRVNAVRSPVLIELRDFPFAHDHSAHAGTDDHRDAMWIFLFHPQAGVSHSLCGSDQCELRIAIHAFSATRIQELCGIEVENLSGDPRPIRFEGKIGKRRNGRNAGTALERRFPKFGHAYPDRRDHS